MFRKGLIACALLFVAFLAGARLASTQERDAGGAPPGFDAEAMKKMMMLAQPGPEHEALAKRAGEWETEVTLQMMPGAPPQKQQGTASSKMILGNRYLEITSHGAFMGMPFEARVFVGFDRRHEEYTMVGFDTMGTYWVTAKGKRDADGVIRMKGEDDDPTGKQVYTFEYEILGPDEHEFRTVFHQIGPMVYEEPVTMVAVRSKRKAG